MKISDRYLIPYSFIKLFYVGKKSSSFSGNLIRQLQLDRLYSTRANLLGVSFHSNVPAFDYLQ